LSERILSADAVAISRTEGANKMGLDQPSDQSKNSQSSAPATIEIQAAKPSTGNENLHSLFIKDILDLPTMPVAPKQDAMPVPPRAAMEQQLGRQQTITPPETYSAPRTMDSPVYHQAGPEVAGPSQFYGGRPGQFSSRNFAPPGMERPGPLYEQPQQPPPGRDMTYRTMSRAAQVAQGLAEGQPPQELFAGLRRRQFQPPQVGQQRRPELPPGAPQEQPRQRLFGKGLFRGPEAAPKNEPMQKHQFVGQNETGVIKEMEMPAKFKEVPKDPAMPPGADPIQREFTVPGSRSHLSMYEPRELSPDEQKSLAAILAKPGKLQPNTTAYDEACMLMGAGYHTFVNNPQVSVGKFNGRNALILTDEGVDENRQPLVGHTIIVPSDKGQMVYAISFDGHKSDFPAVKKGLDSIKWRQTPDAVVPPAPGPKK